MTPRVHHAKPERKNTKPQYELYSAHFLIRSPESKLLEATAYDSDHGFYCECKEWKFRKRDWDCPHITYAKTIVNGS